MTHMTTNETDGLALALRRIARWGLSVAGVALGTGLIAAGVGSHALARTALITGLLAIVALPVVNVVVTVAEETRRREWVFVAVAMAVLAVLMYNVGHLLLMW
jgi:uncharacterized membrane protein